MAITIDGTNGITHPGGGIENPPGAAPIFGCRAWVRFDGTKDSTGAASSANTNRQILGSGNVASVLRNGTGDYTITFTTALPDANFAVVNGTNTRAGDATDRVYPPVIAAQTSSTVRVLTSLPSGDSNNVPSANDISKVMIAVFR